MSVADRRAVAGLLRVAAEELADAGLPGLGARSAWLLLGRGAWLLWEAVLVSERRLPAMAARLAGPQAGPDAGRDALPDLERDALDDANPLKARLLEFGELAAGAHRREAPDRAGRLRDPGGGPSAALVRGLGALLDDAMRAFEVDPGPGDAPAGRTEPLRPAPVAPVAPVASPAPVAAPRASKRASGKVRPREGGRDEPPGVSRDAPRIVAPVPALLVAPRRASGAGGAGPIRRSRGQAPSPLAPDPKPVLASDPAPDSEPTPEAAEPRREREVAPVSSVAFWALMDRWKVSDLAALGLIGHAKALTKTGGRPRFRLVGPEAGLFAVLREIDATLTLASQDPAQWLRGARRGAPLGGQTPLEHMGAHGMAGARAVHHLAVQESLARSMG